MRVLLQNMETKLYFAGPNEWTSDSSKALDFEQIERASEVYSAQNLDYAQIVLDPQRPNAWSEITGPAADEFDRPKPPGSSGVAPPA
jgi:hypothetical protein